MIKRLCSDCGICCRMPDGTDCKWLRWKKNGKSYCRIFLTRLGRHLGRGVYCWPIMKVNRFYRDCPYNAKKLSNVLKGSETKYVKKGK